MRYFRFQALLQANGWLSPAWVGVDLKGNIVYLNNKPPAQATAVEVIEGVALPGFTNAHSHAFQYAMAGCAEVHNTETTDDFWSWRTHMYRCALAMTPDDMEKTARQCYARMLANGYTHVTEFHYLHHDESGKPYSNRAEMGERLLAAAAATGIRITLVPVFYQRGGFDQEALPEQRRFICPTTDAYFRLLDDTARAVKHYERALLGCGIHSLRAAEPPAIMDIIRNAPAGLPFHLHAAEQKKEVEDCLKHMGKRPVEWILENGNSGKNLHLVHCTHLSNDEVTSLAASGAHVVLCPSTEANLGDGIFRLKEFARAGGRFSIGSDSQVCLNPLEEMRWLDYGQRLVTHQRNTFDDGGHTLMRQVIFSGRSAAGIPSTEFFEPGRPLDLVVYKTQENWDEESLVSRLIYGPAAKPCRVMVAGVWQ